ncbi:MAG TPA: hypothetical protein VH879_08360 [Gemmatimonadales bacterium]|jgi:hypothetical protein
MQRGLLLATALAVLAATALDAQTITTPIYKSPYRSFKHSELGGYLSDPGEGVSAAIQGEYRLARPSFDFGFTVGYLDGEGGSDNLFGVGIDGRVPVARHSKDFPLDASLTGGFGALFGGGESGFLVPFGATLGRQVLLENSSVSFTPYVAPVIAPTFGDLLDDVQFGLGLGVDIALTRTFDIRVSGSLGDIEGVGVGVAWHR